MRAGTRKWTLFGKRARRAHLQPVAPRRQKRMFVARHPGGQGEAPTTALIAVSHGWTVRRNPTLFQPRRCRSPHLMEISAHGQQVCRRTDSGRASVEHKGCLSGPSCSRHRNRRRIDDHNRTAQPAHEEAQGDATQPSKPSAGVRETVSTPVAQALHYLRFARRSDQTTLSSGRAASAGPSTAKSTSVRTGRDCSI